MATIVVTGAAGFIGYHTAKALLLQGHRVIGLDNVNDYYAVSLKRDRLRQLSSLDADWVFHEVDIAQRDAIFSCVDGEKIDYIVHLAAQAGVRYSIEAPQAYINANITGTLALLDLAKVHEVEHFLFASSSSVYGEDADSPFDSAVESADHPVSMYAATKRSNEMMAHVYAKLYGLPCSGLRFFTVYGPWGRPDMAPMKFANAILNGEPIDVYNRGEQYRDFTFIDDIVHGVVGLLPHKPAPLPPNTPLTSDRGRVPYRIYNIGAQTPVHLMSFITTLESVLGRKATLNMMPAQPGDVPYTCADVTPLVSVTGYRPSVSLSSGLADFGRWYLDYYKK